MEDTSEYCPTCNKIQSKLYSERVKQGLRKAKAKGVQLGRPIKTVNMNEIYLLWVGGNSVRDIATALGLSRTMVHNRLQKIKTIKTLLTADNLRREINLFLKENLNEKYATQDL